MSDKKTSLKKYFLILWGLVLIPVISFALLITLIANGVFGELPTFEELENPKTYLASEIYTADQKLMGTFFAENRMEAHYSELSPHLINALIATEDVRFYQHSGIDLRALMRVVKGLITMNPNQGGGSTLTQQLAKQLFKTRSSLKGGLAIEKLAEWIIAVQLEKRYTKEEILTMYLNKFDFLYNAIGIKSASNVYFNTSPDSLKLEEAATLVGMVKNPSLFNPRRRHDTTMHRRNVVLHQMVRYDYLDQSVYDSLKTDSIHLEFNVVDHNEGLATYFREFLRGELTQWCKNNQKPDGENYDLYRDGLKIYTTINSKMQGYAEEAVSKHLEEMQEIFFNEHQKRWDKDKAPFYHVSEKEIERIMNRAMRRSERYRKMMAAGVPEDSIKMSFHEPTEMTVFSWEGEIDTVMTPMDSIRYYKHFLQAGLMSMDPHTGYVKAWVGGINYRHFKYDHVKHGKRQVGSTFKPFVYALAMQEGYSPCHEVLNRPYTFDKEKYGLPKDWSPKNSTSEDEGKMVSLEYALAHSINYITAWVMKQFGPQAVINLVRKMGISSEIEPYPSICLGTPDVSVYEMVAANATFANKGVYTEPIYMTRIEDKNGNILQEFVPQTTEAMSEETAFATLKLMEGVVRHGSGIRLRYKYGLKNPIAGKTGTTQNHSDGWFMGITPSLVTGVWVGNEDRSAHFRYITHGQGASLALPVWALYMKEVYADTTLGYNPEEKFEPPSEAMSIEFNCEQYKKNNGLKKNPYNQGLNLNQYE